MKNKTCTFCKNKFCTVDKRKKFCSFRCYNNYRNSKRVSRPCLSCGKAFIAHPKAIFCSKSCASKHNNQGKTLSDSTKERISAALKTYNELHPRRSSVKVIVCAQCNTEFIPDKSYRKYCSVKCYNDNKNRRPIRKISTRTFHKMLRRAFSDWQCPFCDWKETFVVHHINGRKDNSIEALVMLCPNHHSLADGGLIVKEQLFQHAIGAKITTAELLRFYHGTIGDANVNFDKYPASSECRKKNNADRRMVSIVKVNERSPSVNGSTSA